MGYTWEGMTKISYEEAKERWNNKQEVYLLYDDETEGLLEDGGFGTALEKLERHHGYGGEFGYE